ncbi:hypothetical protein [Dinghuibacter silviterrae]|uniref:DUF5723 domain-containing protein n=1 Tax=Dinghuibacter silviterrae TaxID=1539049 RepID=A0A4R8DQ29_9BACT|nr:hypothetical protein [Dinghuibacter silviterrae]TDX00224.1 hypothetical protein EDB95_1243 [Dinghuibacter silviterrae]
MKKLLVVMLGMSALSHALAQNYQALHGSPYSGSLSNDYNPAAILNSPYTWDLTLLGVQGKFLTNSFNVTNASLLHIPDTFVVKVHSGTFSRNFMGSVDLHLLNGRISINRRSAFGFGLNMRNYVRVSTSSFNYNDSTKKTGSFFTANEGNLPLSANVVQSSWLEGYLTYAHVLYEDDGARLQIGGTLNITRSLSGGYAFASSGTYIPDASGGYQITNIAAQYGYSSNYNNWKNGSPATDEIKEAVKRGRMGASVSIGGEYVQKSGEDWGKEEKSGTDAYIWKLGVALLDMGTNQYTYGNASAVFSGIKGVVTDSMLNTTFGKIQSVPQFSDSVRAKVANFNYIGGRFNIATPARLVVNLDERFSGYWAVDGELSINMTGIHSTLASVQELNLLTITPRWEKSSLGAYLPIEVTDQGHFWVGGAIKAGPVLLGFHNLAWLVSKKAMPNGGGYLAIIIHPGAHEGDGLACPRVKF